jgi:hypothetical protein
VAILAIIDGFLRDFLFGYITWIRDDYAEYLVVLKWYQLFVMFGCALGCPIK